MNKIFCSTGVMVGKINNYNYNFIPKYFPDLINEGLIDGAEFMFAGSFYDKLDDIFKTISKSNIDFEVLHCDKDIGIMLSECDKSSTNKALELTKINCDFAKQIGSNKAVFHLWGGPKSDSHIEYNISILPKIIEIFKQYELELLVENIPCIQRSGLQIWKLIYNFLPDIGFIFDTRFGAFHGEFTKVFNDNFLWNHIKHIHISDYSSYPKNFSKIRPILHPSEGVINFDYVFKRLNEIGYLGTYTLESPVMHETTPNIKKLKDTLIYINKCVKSHD